MNHQTLKKMLEKVKDGQTSVQDALAALKDLYFEDMGFAHVDHHRSIRKGFPEVIYGGGKTVEQIACIMERMASQGDVVLVTRLDPDKGLALSGRFPQSSYDEQARMLVLEETPLPDKGRGKIVVACAGTSDIPVAKEAYLTAKTMGNSVDLICDVGVAGLHRLLAYRQALESATVIVAVAGMEGALPSVVAGLFAKPVIAVPTSIGYGTSFNGLTALLAMLNSCASNVAVVNIDNGFGGGYVASMINRG
jgi:NCAIR mutase (PurE)-related protein